MKTVILLALGAILGVSGWYLIAHAHYLVWWMWLAIGFASGSVVGASVTYVATCLAIGDAFGRALGW